ncbi:hypothetical protein YB2330_004683 [Saitoella coloradoensis]
MPSRSRPLTPLTPRLGELSYDTHTRSGYASPVSGRATPIPGHVAGIRSGTTSGSLTPQTRRFFAGDESTLYRRFEALAPPGWHGSASTFTFPIKPDNPAVDKWHVISPAIVERLQASPMQEFVLALVLRGTSGHTAEPVIYLVSQEDDVEKHLEGIDLLGLGMVITKGRLMVGEDTPTLEVESVDDGAVDQEELVAQVDAAMRDRITCGSSIGPVDMPEFAGSFGCWLENRKKTEYYGLTTSRVACGYILPDQVHQVDDFAPVQQPAAADLMSPYNINTEIRRLEAVFAELVKDAPDYNNLPPRTHVVAETIGLLKSYGKRLYVGEATYAKDGVRQCRRNNHRCIEDWALLNIPEARRAHPPVNEVKYNDIERDIQKTTVALEAGMFVAKMGRSTHYTHGMVNGVRAIVYSRMEMRLTEEYFCLSDQRGVDFADAADCGSVGTGARSFLNV